VVNQMCDCSGASGIASLICGSPCRSSNEIKHNRCSCLRGFSPCYSPENSAVSCADHRHPGENVVGGSEKLRRRSLIRAPGVFGPAWSVL
jgi:hypothetical protein